MPTLKCLTEHWTHPTSAPVHLVFLDKHNILTLDKGWICGNEILDWDKRVWLRWNKTLMKESSTKRSSRIRMVTLQKVNVFVLNLNDGAQWIFSMRASGQVEELFACLDVCLFVAGTVYYYLPKFPVLFLALLKITLWAHFLVNGCQDFSLEYMNEYPWSLWWYSSTYLLLQYL